MPRYFGSFSSRRVSGKEIDKRDTERVSFAFFKFTHYFKKPKRMLKKLISWCHRFDSLGKPTEWVLILHQSIHDARKVYLTIQRFNKITGEVTWGVERFSIKFREENGCFDFASLCSVIGRDNSCHALNKWVTRLKLNATWPPTLSLWYYTRSDRLVTLLWFSFSRYLVWKRCGH